MKLLRYFPPFFANILTIILVGWSFHMPWTHVVVLMGEDEAPLRLKFPFEVGLFHCYSDVCTDFIDILAPNSTLSRFIKSPATSISDPPENNGDHFTILPIPDLDPDTNLEPVEDTLRSRALYYRPKLPSFATSNSGNVARTIMEMKREIVVKFERPFVVATMRTMPFIIAGMALCFISVVWSIYVYIYHSTARVERGDIVRSCRMPRQVRMLYAAMLLLFVGGGVYVFSTFSYIAGGWYCYGFVLYSFNVVVGCLCGLIAVAAKEAPRRRSPGGSYSVVPDSPTDTDTDTDMNIDNGRLARVGTLVSGHDSGVGVSYQQMFIEMVEMNRV